MGYVSAMPVPVTPGLAHGAAPNVSVASKTFLPDALGVMVPVIAQPPLLAVKAPSAPIFIEKAAPLVADRFQAPVMADNRAGVL